MEILAAIAKGVQSATCFVLNVIMSRITVLLRRALVTKGLGDEKMIAEMLEKVVTIGPVECGPGEKCEEHPPPCGCYGGTVRCVITYIG